MNPQKMPMSFYSFGAFADARAQRLGKTLTYTGTSGALVLESIDRMVEMLVNYRNVVRLNIPRVAGESDNYKVVQRTSGATLGEFVAETGDFTSDEGSYAKVSFPFKTLGTRGQIGRFAQQTGRTFANVMITELDAKSEDLKDFEEYYSFYGTKSGIATQFDGLHYLTDSGQVVGMTTGATSVALTLAKLDELWDQTNITPDLAIMSPRTKQQVAALLQSVQRFNDMVEVNGGFVVQSYQGTPLLKSSRMLNTLAWDGSAVSSLTSGTGSQIFVLNTDKVFVAELTPLTMMMLARSTSQYEGFDLFCDEVLVCKNKYGLAYLAGISA